MTPVNGEHIFSVDPRVFKFVTFSQNAGMFVTDMNSLADVDLQHNRGNANLIKGTYLDPVTGLLFDLYINYTCDTWVIQLKLIWDMWVLPEYVCQVVGVNGLMLENLSTSDYSLSLQVPCLLLRVRLLFTADT